MANAHIASLDKLLQKKISNETLNLGYGEGHSVKEIIRNCKKISGKKAVVELAGRREGDPPRLVACSKKAYRMLDWEPDYTSKISLKLHGSGI